MTKKEQYMEAFKNADINKKVKIVKLFNKSKILRKDSYHELNDYIDSMAEVLNLAHPNRWDIILSENKGRITKQPTTWKRGDSNFYVNIIIHFPEIRITNSENMQLLIKDMYIALKLKWDGSTFYSFGGIRMSATREQIQSNYQHSHMPSRPYIYKKGNTDHSFYFRNFCLGTSEVKQALTMLSCGYTPERFKLFLFQLEEYLNWESIEGGPYVHMEHVVGGGKIGLLGRNIVKDYIDNLLEERKSIKKELDFVLDKGKIRISDNEKLEDYVKIQTLNKYSSTICQKDNKGNYLRYKVLPEAFPPQVLGDQENLKLASFYFKGELIEFKINQKQEEGDKPFYVHKQIKKNVKTKIEQKIEEERFRGHITKQLNTIENTSKSTGQNRIFVPED